MIITIIGWYGTETIGDRAILAGLLSFFSKAFNNFEIKLGSLYPFFTERTLYEDFDFYTNITQKKIKITIFNSKESRALSKAINDSDLIVMGGGPLMDLDELFMIEYAFKNAKKQSKKTALMGCGIGPLFKKKYRKSVLEISKHSDLIILRDNISKQNLSEIYTEFNQKLPNNPIKTSLDPSVECILNFNTLKNKMQSSNSYIAINLRDFPLEYGCNDYTKNMEKKLTDFINKIAIKFKNKKVKLIPMHYFHAGNDDRLFLNKIALKSNNKNLVVQNENLTLEETLTIYQNAFINIGMRFHSVVFQTLTNGKNYILDYTEPKKGKISGFLQEIDSERFYNSRTIILQEQDIKIDMIKKTSVKFTYSTKDIHDKLYIYEHSLKTLSKE